MTSTKDIVDQLRTDMEDAADDVRLMNFLRLLSTTAQRLGIEQGIDRKTTAYALASVACALCNVVEDRNPVLIALARSWPDMFAEVTPEEFQRLAALKDGDTASRKPPH